MITIAMLWPMGDSWPTTCTVGGYYYVYRKFEYSPVSGRAAIFKPRRVDVYNPHSEYDHTATEAA